MSLRERMTRDEVRASASLASIFGLRMLGLFLILPVFAVHARGMPGGQSSALVGLALGVYGLTQALLQVVYGAASDRWGRKPVIVLGLLLLAAGSFVAATATTLELVVVGRALQGAGAISAAITALLADLTRDSQRTKAMAMVGGTIGLAFALSMVAAPPLYALVGVAGLFAGTGLLAFASIGLVLWVVPAAPARLAAPLPGGWRSVVLAPELQRLNFGVFVLNLGLMSVFMVVPGQLIETGGLPLAEHWKVYLPTVLVSFALMMPPMLAAERRGRVREVFVGAIALLVLVQFGLAWWAASLASLAAWLLLFFVGFNILEAMQPSLVSRVAPPAAKGLALGIYNTTQSIGLGLGAVGAGWLVDRYGRSTVFMLGAALLSVWLVVALWTRVPARRDAGGGQAPQSSAGAGGTGEGAVAAAGSGAAGAADSVAATATTSTGA